MNLTVRGTEGNKYRRGVNFHGYASGKNVIEIVEVCDYSSFLPVRDESRFCGGVSICAVPTDFGNTKFTRDRLHAREPVTSINNARYTRMCIDRRYRSAFVMSMLTVITWMKI